MLRELETRRGNHVGSRLPPHRGPAPLDPYPENYLPGDISS